MAFASVSFCETAFADIVMEFPHAKHTQALDLAGGEGLRSLLPEGWFTDLLIDGAWAGLGGIVIFVPQIAMLFFFISILEDSGYMSRVVFLMDRIVRPIGFSGKSVIPLIGGMACAVPSVMMARNIPSRSERIITIMVTCSMYTSMNIR